MVLHLGADVTVSSKKIVAILDAETVKASETTQNYLKNSQEKGYSVYISDEQYKSIIITLFNGRHRIYYSPISAATLCKRSAFINESIL